MTEQDSDANARDEDRDIARQVELYLKVHNLSIVELAREAGMSISTIITMKRGEARSQPKSKRAMQLFLQARGNDTIQVDPASRARANRIDACTLRPLTPAEVS